jgi:SulP family sulfate permease
MGFMLVAAPLASYIPLAGLAGVLVAVAWNMAEKTEFLGLLRASRGDAVVLVTTFLLVVFRDLTEGILVGFCLGALLFLHRMAQSVEVDQPETLVDESLLKTDPEIMVLRISGAFFFGAAAAVATALDQIGTLPKAYVIDLSGVPVLDSTAAATLQGFAHKAGRKGAPIYIVGARPEILRTLLSRGLRPPQVRFRSILADTIIAAQERVRMMPS